MASALGRDFSLGIWASDEAVEALVLRGHEALISGIEFSPDGKLLGSSSHDGYVSIRGVEDWQIKRTLGPHNAQVYGLAFSPPTHFAHRRTQGVEFCDSLRPPRIDC